MFLSSNERQNGMGILKLEIKNNNTFGNIKTYQSNLHGDYILGIKTDNKVIKQSITLDNNNYNFILNDNNNLESIHGAVLIQVENGEFKPILWGNNKGHNYKANIINSLRQSINNITNSKLNTIQNKSVEVKKSEDKICEEESKLNITDIIENEAQVTKDTVKDIPNANSNIIDINDVYAPIKNNNHCDIETLAQIPIKEEPINNNLSEVAIASNPSALFENSDEEISEIIDQEMKKSSHDFYNMIADQLEELFNRYPKEENLMKLIENSEWVKIDTDIDNKYHVVGIIRYNNDIKYICYGVPGNYMQEPPIELREYSQWLPTDITDPYNKGYWVMYQDADTGENVYIN